MKKTMLSLSLLLAGLFASSGCTTQASLDKAPSISGSWFMMIHCYEQYNVTQGDSIFSNLSMRCANGVVSFGTLPIDGGILVAHLGFLDEESKDQQDFTEYLMPVEVIEGQTSMKLETDSIQARYSCSLFGEAPYLLIEGTRREITDSGTVCFKDHFVLRDNQKLNSEREALGMQLDPANPSIGADLIAQ